MSGIENMVKVGIGYDVHRLVEGRKLILGGVDIPYALGLDGHSDADVLTHAVCDAVLGALGLGDIGDHFPDTDEKYKGISSLELLIHVNALAQEKGYTVKNVDAIVAAQEPKLKEHKGIMAARMAEALQIDEGLVNVKATTTEGLGPVGRKEGIAAFATVLIKQINP